MYFGMHNHDEFSNVTTGLDSINKLDDLVTKAKELGLKGIAITNHDNLCEIININDKQKELRKNNDDFVLAIGNEIYLVNSFDPEDKLRERYFHFLLIAKDEMGLKGLIELSSRAWYRSAMKWGKRRVPTLKSDFEELMPKYKGHIVASTACIGGEFAQLVLNEKYEEAYQFIKWCQTIFGKDDFFLELQPSRSKEQKDFNKFIYTHYQDWNCVITTDAHYQNKEDFPLFEAFLRSQQENREVKEYYDFARLMDEEEIFELMKENDIPAAFVRQCLDNTLKVAEQIKFFDLDQKPKIPKAPLERENGKTLKIGDGELEKALHCPTLNWAWFGDNEQTKYCITTCLNELSARNIFNDEYLSRLEEEFDVFKFQSEEYDDNFFQYFNTMQHYIDMAWSIGCAVGPSRGSASGSLICYLMDVVQCDPIQYGLPFFRFANKVRTSPLKMSGGVKLGERAQRCA